MQFQTAQEGTEWLVHLIDVSKRVEQRLYSAATSFDELVYS